MRTLQRRLRLFAALIGLAMMGMAGHANASLIVDGSGQLLGAKKVDVGGALFNVTFVDSTCRLIFAGCDAAADFDFPDSASAVAAAQALLDQVFVDDFAGSFDTDPGLTFGCDLAVESCTALIPFGAPLAGGIITFQGARNRDPAFGLDEVELLGAFRDFTGRSFTYASFTPVPEPSTLLLFGVGLAGLAFIRRRRWHV